MEEEITVKQARREIVIAMMTGQFSEREENEAYDTLKALRKMNPEDTVIATFRKTKKRK